MRCRLLLLALGILVWAACNTGPVHAQTDPRTPSDGIEMQVWPRPTGLLSVGVAAFVDVARPGSLFASAALPLQADVGAGLRVHLPTQSERLLLDVARGVRDGQVAVSVGVESDRLFHD